MHFVRSPRFEPFLTLALGNEHGQGLAPEDWLEIAHLAGDLADIGSPSAMLSALRALPAATFLTDDRRQAALSALANFLPTFWVAWSAATHAYEAAAERLQTRIDGAQDIGAALGLPIELEPRRRGLRAPGHRLVPNRIARIEISPSAFNTRGFWHLGAVAGGRQVIYLPARDDILAGFMKGGASAGSATAQPAAAEARIALVLRALGDQSRLAITQLLARETLSAADIGRRLDLSAPAVSYHLGDLRKAGLIRTRPQGAALEISLDPDAFEDLGARVLAYLKSGPMPGRSRRKS